MIPQLILDLYSEYETHNYIQERRIEELYRLTKRLISVWKFTTDGIHALIGLGTGDDPVVKVNFSILKSAEFLP